MRRAIVLFGAGLLALLVQSSLAVVIPAPFCPDLGLLVVVAVGLYWQPLPSRFLLATGLGYASDVLSGSLLGQHALLRLLSFAAARLGGRQLNLRGVLPLAMFVAGLTIAYAVALHTLLVFFTGVPVLAGSRVGSALIHALVNGLAAPFVAAGVERLCSWSAEDEGARRGFRLEGGAAP